MRKGRCARARTATEIGRSPQIMPDETSEPEPPKENKKEKKIHDMTPKDDVKAGAPDAEKNEKAAPRRTGEIDFMKYLKYIE